MTNNQVSYPVWKRFIEDGIIDQSVPQVIADSWRRCQRLNLDPFNRNLIKINDMHSIMERNRMLISNSLRVINLLQELTFGSGSAIVLVDADGNILEVTGDTEIVEMGKSNGMVPGANRTEEKAGTNAIGVALKVNEPVQLTGCQHFNFYHHRWTCSAAPIHNSKGEVIGVINVTEPCSLVHRHALGMVTAAAKVIESEINRKDAELSIKLANEWLKGVVNQVNDGIALIDRFGSISEANLSFANLMGKRPEDVISINFSSLINYQGDLLDQLQHKTYSETQIIYSAKDGLKKELTVRMKQLRDEDKGIIGTVAIIGENRKVQQRSICNKKLGAQATVKFNDIVGNNVHLRKAIETAQIASLSQCTILLQGETGTGKELFAQAIHNASPVKDGPFIAVNCGAIPHDLIESELFGYDDGAFTGAKRGGKPGMFELAQDGTILLDEINSMPLDMQVKLLRVLQENRLIRVGGTAYIDLNVRIIASCNENLEDLIENSTFRRDLYYRLSTVIIEIPPLRERLEDMPCLIKHILRKITNKYNKIVTSIDEDVMRALTAYRWPGNIRELENIIERAVILSTRDKILIDDLPKRFSPSINQKTAKILELRNSYHLFSSESTCALDDIEQEAIKNVLNSTGGNILKAAKLLGITRNTLYRKIQKYGL